MCKNVEIKHKKKHLGLFSPVMLTLILLTLTVLFLASCVKPDFSGEFKDAQKAVWELNSSAVTFNESDSYQRYDLTDIFLNFDNKEDIEPTCKALKEKLKGLDVPWIRVGDDYEAEVFQALKGLDCKHIGLIIKLYDDTRETFNDSAVDLLKTGCFTHLWIVNADKIDEKGIQRIPEIHSIKELYISPNNGNKHFSSFIPQELFSKFPSVTTLKTAGGSCPGSAVCLPSVKHLENLNERYNIEKLANETDRTDPYFNAFAYQFYLANPQLETINGDPADNFDGKAELDEKGIARYNAVIQKAQLKELDLSDYKEIPFDKAVLHGKIAVICPEYDNFSNFDVDGDHNDYLSQKLQAVLANDPAQHDAIIRVTTERKYIGTYTGGEGEPEKAYALETYLEVIDPAQKTVTQKYCCATDMPDDYLIRGSRNSGDNVGSFSHKTAWKAIEELYLKAYQKD